MECRVSAVSAVLGLLVVNKLVCCVCVLQADADVQTDELTMRRMMMLLFVVICAVDETYRVLPSCCVFWF